MHHVTSPLLVLLLLYVYLLSPLSLHPVSLFLDAPTNCNHSLYLKVKAEESNKISRYVVDRNCNSHQVIDWLTDGHIILLEKEDYML